MIDGNALIGLGLRPGPRLGRILNELHDRILAGEIRSRNEAIAAARDLITGGEGK